MSKKYTKYKTPQNQSKAVKYWDKVYHGSDFWFDWIALKTTAEYHAKEIQEEEGLSLKEAREIVWNAYIDATEGNEDSPMWIAYEDFCMSLSDIGFAIYTPHLTIGTNIHYGHSEKKAKKMFVDWLRKSPKNPVYGLYRINEDLEILQTKKLKKLRK